MPRTGKFFAALVGVGMLSGLVVAAGDGSTLLANYTDTLNKASGLKVDFLTRKGTDAPVSYTLTFAKPNLARIDTPSKLIVADGKNITTYEKAQNRYLVLPQTEADLKQLLKPDEFLLFAPFFDSAALNTAGAQDLGPTEHGGRQVETIQFSLGTKSRTAKAFIDKSDNLVHQAQITLQAFDSHGNPGTQSQIISTKEITVISKPDESLFAFKPPTDATQVTLADLQADRWYTDLNEAEQIAASTHRKIFVDFMASWCGPCHMLHDQVLATDDFKKYSKYFVFVQIDVDEQPSVAAAYEVNAMPTQLILDPQGTILDKIVGYGGPDMFYSFINKNTN